MYAFSAAAAQMNSRAVCVKWLAAETTKTTTSISSCRANTAVVFVVSRLRPGASIIAISTTPLFSKDSSMVRTSLT
ncbi:hypothetical protein EYC80_000397 [Monilinia laxa]|uniref:Uncharacterized protein n=1 Tax=Monilinia laxa TaxID=61186 RepID=A0A5N6KAL7_MONLA|nr:hypothetical protein EYC80_000397 [Monilinia laxa]